MNRLSPVILLIILIVNPLISSDNNLFFSRDEKNLFLHINIPIKNESEFQKRLSSGLSNKIIISIQMKDKKTNKMVINRDFIFEAVFDVWDEKYRIFLYEPTKRLILETIEKGEVYKRLLNPEKILVCENSLLQSDSVYQVKVKVIINPISKEIIEKIKEYLADPQIVGQGSPTRTIFGSFANTFIPELNTENVIKYEIKAFSIGEISEKR
ncbi:MAG: hypothetical protein ACP5QK_04275 [Myxococcota bacterium]